MKKFLGLIFTLVLFTAVTVFPQDKTDYSKYPGYVDFGNISKFMSGDRVTQIELDANLLKMLSKMGGEKNADFQDVVSGLKLIRVNSFGLDAKNEKEVKEKITAIDQSLANKKWQRIIMVKEAGEYTNVYVLPSSDYENFLGLCVTTIDKNGKKGHDGPEATFVNIVGNIKMSQIGRLGEKFHIPGLGKADRKNEKKEKNEKK
jgi:hypothetical protein